ncbi:MAG TPA: alkaline phosphatase PhoX [Gemmatimonadaceae bacterium]|nr:alkaline phosphatase PhoX [Gemmatimonadaceae bacterium]
MHRIRRTVTIALLVGASTACQDDLTRPHPILSSRPLLSSSDNQFANFTPLASSASCVTPPAAIGGFSSYQPFVLPAGYTQTIVADQVTDFTPIAGSGGDLPDMNTLNESGPQAGRYLFRTHETGSNGAVTVLDRLTGVVSLVDQAQHYEALDGIVWTPWNTLLFAEERIIASFKDPRVPNAVGGLVYEWDPVTRTTRPLPAVGARSHEGLRFDAQGNLYGISETNPSSTLSGAIYKFVPDRRGDLTSGQLYALKVLDGVARTGDAVWVPLDRNAVQINSDLAAVQAGATGWGRPEDIEINTASGNVAGGAQVMFIASTTEELVLRIELHGDRAYVSNFVQQGVNVSGLDNPDNLAIDNQGTLYILEDNGPGDIWAVRHSGRPERVASEVVRFASLSDCSGEPTGLYFDRNGQSAWVHVQHAGGALSNDLLVEIRKP